MSGGGGSGGSASRAGGRYNTRFFGCCSCALWLEVNVLLLRPLFRHLNAKAFEGWRCSAIAASSAEEDRVGGGDDDTSGLQVLVPSPGHTGTTSLVAALETLGLRTYRYDEIHMYLDDVMIMPNFSQAFVRALRACRVQALVVEPLFHLTPLLLQASPGVKVVYSMRSWEEWSRATRRAYDAQQGVERFAHAMRSMLCHWLPYAWLLPHAEVVGMSYTQGWRQHGLLFMLLENCVRLDGLRLPVGWELHDYDALLENESAFVDLLLSVKRLVPKQDLLQFDTHAHGWSELVGHVDASATSALSELPSFPWHRRGNASPVLDRWVRSPWRFTCFWALLSLSLLANYMAFILAFWLLCFTIQ